MFSAIQRGERAYSNTHAYVPAYLSIRVRVVIRTIRDVILKLPLWVYHNRMSNKRVFCPLQHITENNQEVTLLSLVPNLWTVRVRLHNVKSTLDQLDLMLAQRCMPML